ncbi:acyltransferase family protein [Methyloversatilis sp. MC4-4]|uniref:acyltransferase family protein n=1 Tax=Methyloversatilis sp. MC4-4 TaxID=3132824 RepID=UPI003CF0C871
MGLQRGREVSLDLVRGLAIILVVFYHVNIPATVSPVLSMIQSPARQFGWVGVDVFFVLSGFLVGRLLLQAIERSGFSVVPSFLVRRAFKIWPVFFAYLIARLAFDSDPWENYLIQNLLHVQNYFVSSVKHTWSLAVEEHFYVTFPLLLLFLRKFFYSRFGAVVFLGLFFFIFCLFLRSVATINGVSDVDIQWQTQYRVDALFFGVMIAGVDVYRKSLYEKIEKMVPVLLAVVVAWILSLYLLSNWPVLKVSVGYSMNILGAAAILILLRGCEDRISRFWFVRAIAWIGVCSYATYLWHLALFKISKSMIVRFTGHTSLDEVLFFLICYAVIFLGGFVLTAMMERPALYVRERYFPMKARGG